MAEIINFVTLLTYLIAKYKSWKQLKQTVDIRKTIWIRDILISINLHEVYHEVNNNAAMQHACRLNAENCLDYKNCLEPRR